MTINIELRDEQAARLDRFATGIRKTRSEATAQLIEEGFRHAEFPTIEFRDSVIGREAYLVGTRLAVWQILMIAEGYGLDVNATAAHLHLDEDQVSRALGYAANYESEIRHALEENRAVTSEQLGASLSLHLFEVR